MDVERSRPQKATVVEQIGLIRLDQSYEEEEEEE